MKSWYLNGANEISALAEKDLDLELKSGSGLSSGVSGNIIY